MKKSPIAIALSLILFQSCFAADLYFPPEFFGSDKQAVADLSHFTVDGAQMPGNYQVDVFLNDEPVGVKIIAFTSRKSSGVSIESAYDNTGLTPCLSARYIQDLGVKSSLYPVQLTMNASL